MPDAFTALEADWDFFARSQRGATALRRWAAEDERYRQFASVSALRESFETREFVRERDELLADLIWRSPKDNSARLIVLAAIRPGLIRLARRIAAVLGREEASSVILSTAIDRLSIPYPRPPERAAARVLGDVWHKVWINRERERKHDAFWATPLDSELAERVPAEVRCDGAEDFLDLVEEAMRDERITEAGARLVVMHRVLGYTNVEIARMEGLQACTVRKRRREAEIEIAEIAVA